MRYIIARTPSKRPTLQHILGRNGFTLCGLDVAQWSRAYQRHAIAEILCLRCKARERV